MPASVKAPLRRVLGPFFKVFVFPLRTRVKIWRNRKREHRMLEIGPGGQRLPGFETLNIVGSWEVDYMWDAAKKLPFKDDVFECVYASHVLEHIPWYQTEEVLHEWVRTLKSSGHLEIWVPDGLKICKTFVEYELAGKRKMDKERSYPGNPERELCKWASYRIYTYGDWSGRPDHPNWHRALFTPRYLREMLEKVGLVMVRELEQAEIRGEDHGWINLGMVGTKP